MAAAAPPLFHTYERLSSQYSADDDDPTPNHAGEKRGISCVQPESETFLVEADWDDHPPLTIVAAPPDYTCKQYAYKFEFDQSFSEILEVFSVNINKLSLDSIYGEMGYHGGYGVICFFKRNMPSSEEEDITIFKNNRGEEEVLLTGPDDQSMLADEDDGIQICMHLKNYLTDKSYSFGIPFSNRIPSAVFDKLLSATILDDALGSIKINYAVFRNAVAAQVEVLLLDTNTSMGHVSGGIYARNTFYDIRSCLFYTEKPQGICVVPDKDGKLVIPLSRSIVALPNIANLVIDLDLKNPNTGLPIVKGYAEFKVPDQLLVPNEDKDLKMRIPHTWIIGNQIQVTVNWALYFTPYHQPKAYYSTDKTGPILAHHSDDTIRL